MIDKNHHNYYKEFFSPIECERLSSLVLIEEPRVMEIDNPFQHPDSPYKGLTGQHTVYNWYPIRHFKFLMYHNACSIYLILKTLHTLRFNVG